MSLTVSKVGPFFASGSISFSDLRTNFKETSSGSISASELKRDQDTTNTNPIVPDATENNSISVDANLSLSQFRNSIKYYNLTQTDTDLNLDLASSSLWNNNLRKSIVKTITINGTCGTGYDTNFVATSPSANLVELGISNVLLNINGSILGGGGKQGIMVYNYTTFQFTNTGVGGNGFAALFINTRYTGRVTVKTSSGAQVYGGGGGGGAGGYGGNGGKGLYTTYSTSYESTGSTGTKTGLSGEYYQQCQAACEAAFEGSVWDNNCYKTLDQVGQYCNDESDPSNYAQAVCYSNTAAGQAQVTSCKQTITNESSTETAGGRGALRGTIGIQDTEVGSRGGAGEGYNRAQEGTRIRTLGQQGGTNAGRGGASGFNGAGGYYGENGGDGSNGNKGFDGTDNDGNLYDSAPSLGQILGPGYGAAGGLAGRAVAGEPATENYIPANITGNNYTISSESYNVGGTTYPVRGYLYVPNITTDNNEIDVVVCYHGTISDTTTTVLQAAQKFLEIARDSTFTAPNGNVYTQCSLKDKIIFSVAYPQDAIPVTNSLDGTYGGVQNSSFLFGDNLPFARAALLWAKNSLNSYMSSQGLNKVVKRVFMFGHSQGGSLVHKLNTLETTAGVVANAPGPIRLDLTCQNQETLGLVGAGKALNLTNATCQKLYNTYGSAFSSTQYFNRSVQAYTTGHLAPVLYVQGQQDDTGAGQQITWLNTLVSDVDAANTSVPSNGVRGGKIDVIGGHDAFSTSTIAQEGIRHFFDSFGSSTVAPGYYIDGTGDSSAYKGLK